MAIRAKTYKNRKDEQKVQVSMDKAEAVKLVKNDETVTAEFNKALRAAVGTKKAAADAE